MADSAIERETDVLIVAAHAPELSGLRSFLSDALIGTIRGLRIHAKVVGIGLVAAATSTARGLAALRPRAVVLTGSCGVFPGLPEYRPCDVIVADRVQLASYDVIARKSELPPPMETRLVADPALAAGLAAAKARAFVAGVTGSLGRTIDDAAAAAVQRATGCDGESLEAFSVAQACKAADVPFAVVLGVSHVVGSGASESYARHHRGAVTAAAEAIVAWVERGSKGLPHE